MPRGDGTGPNGQGSMTGRGMGFCAGSNAPGFMNQGVGRGMGRGFGRGRGFAFRARALPVQQIPVQPTAQPQVITEAQEKEFLKQELDALKQESIEIEKRLKEL